MVERPRIRALHGFTLVELLVVIGLISVLASLLLPVLGKMRAAAQSTVCTSNLRMLGQAWTMYTTESQGKLMPYIWFTPTTPEAAWNGYWTGIVELRTSGAGVPGDVMLCPSASEVSRNGGAKGYGTAQTAWSGQFFASGTAVCFTPTLYRTSSYGFNRYLTAGGGFGELGRATSLSVIGDLSDVPLFFDCAFADVRPANEFQERDVPAPPDLQGSTLRPGQHEHWRFLLARHGKGVNVCMADGHVRWVGLEEMYNLTWRTDWRKYRLDLPLR